MKRLTIIGTASALTISALLTISIYQQRVTTRPRSALPFTITTDRITYSSNNMPVLTLPNGERRQIRSLLNIAHPLHFGEFRFSDEGIPPGPAWVRVDLSQQTLSVFRAGHEIGSAVILFGTDGKPTPTGVFPILEMAARHRSSLYEADMPYMLRLTRDGVAIHASNVRAGSATHGCIGIPIDFARLIFEQLHTGDIVAIMPEKPIAASS